MEMHPLQTRFIAEIEMLAARNNAVLWAIDKTFTKELFLSSTFLTLWGHAIVEMYRDNRSTNAFLTDNAGNKIFDELKSRIINPKHTILYNIQSPNGKTLLIQDRTFHFNDAQGNWLFVAGVALMINETDLSEKKQHIISDKLDRLSIEYYQLLSLPTLHSSKSPTIPQISLFNENQKKILKYILLGLTAKEIAKKMDLSFRTIEAHTNTIKSLLHVSTKSELVSLAIEKNWIVTNI